MSPTNCWWMCFWESQEKAPSQVILDLNAHRHAALRQAGKGRFFHYYGHDCYLLLIIFCGDHLLCALAQLQYRRQRRQSGRNAEGRSSDPGALAQDADHPAR
jgi:hypothetical protein